MDYYKEYPIRCKHCGELIATYSQTFEELQAAGYSAEEALNELNIMNPCSRMSMTNPPTVTFNMENRDVIEGFKSLDAVVEPDLLPYPTTNPTTSVFGSCLGNKPTPAPQTINPLFEQFTAPTQLMTRTAPLVPSNKVIAEIKPIDIGVQGEAIEVTATSSAEFIPPVQVGIPTINPDPTFVQPTIFVGKNAQSRILNGRTYLAQ